MTKFNEDYIRMVKNPNSNKLKKIFKILFSHTLKYLYFLRKGENSKFSLLLSKYIGRRYGNEIPNPQNIGKGLLLCHGYGITVNENAVLGDFVTLFKGATIGSIRTGERKGAPKIGNRVVLGLNSTVAGGIIIGDDVFICPNSFVNFNVPSNSVVIGNPGVIHHKKSASDDYYYSYSPKNKK